MSDLSSESGTDNETLEGDEVVPDAFRCVVTYVAPASPVYARGWGCLHADVFVSLVAGTVTARSNWNLLTQHVRTAVLRVLHDHGWPLNQPGWSVNVPPLHPRRDDRRAARRQIVCGR